MSTRPMYAVPNRGKMTAIEALLGKNKCKVPMERCTRRIVKMDKGKLNKMVMETNMQCPRCLSVLGNRSTYLAHCAKCKKPQQMDIDVC